MTAPIDIKNMQTLGLPGDVNETSLEDLPILPENKRSLSHLLNNFCDAIDAEVKNLVSDYRTHDSQSSGIFEKTADAGSAVIGGLSASVASMVSGLFRVAPELVSHPIDTTVKIVQKFPEGIEKMGDNFVRGVDLIGDGRLAEGVFEVSKSGTDIASLLWGAKAAVTGAANMVEKGAQFAGREITAAADAVNAGIAGNGGAMATAGGGVFADGAVAAKVITSPMSSSSGLMGGPVLMCAANIVPNNKAGAPANKTPQPAGPGKNTASANKAGIKFEMTTVEGAAQEIVERLGGGNVAQLQTQLVTWIENPELLELWAKSTGNTVIELAPERLANLARRAGIEVDKVSPKQLAQWQKEAAFEKWVTENVTVSVTKATEGEVINTAMRAKTTGQIEIKTSSGREMTVTGWRDGDKVRIEITNKIKPGELFQGAQELEAVAREVARPRGPVRIR